MGVKGQEHGQAWGLGDEWGEPLQMTFEEPSLTNPQYLSEAKYKKLIRVLLVCAPAHHVSPSPPACPLPLCFFPH